MGGTLTKVDENGLMEGFSKEVNIKIISKLGTGGMRDAYDITVDNKPGFDLKKFRKVRRIFDFYS